MRVFTERRCSRNGGGIKKNTIELPNVEVRWRAHYERGDEFLSVF